MSENLILKSLEHNPATLELLKEDGQLGNLSMMEEALLLAAAFQQDHQTRIVVKKNKYEAQQLYTRLALLQQEVLCFTMDESLRISAIAASPEEKINQLSALYQMRQDFSKIIVTNVAAYMRFLPDVDFFDQSCIQLKVGRDVSRKELSEKLNRIGYAKVNYAEMPCSYASRGGILDVFSINYPDPIRIEFFDTEIESIRFFNPDTQRTIRSIDEVVLIPATEVLFSDQQIEQLQTIVPEQLEKQLKKTNPDGAEFLQDAIESDLRAIEAFDTQSKLYRYYTFVETSNIHDYVEGAKVIYSPAEDVEENAKKVVLDNATYMQEEVQDFQALARYTMFHDLYTIDKKRNPFKISVFLPFDHPIESGIRMVDAPGINYREWVVEEAKKENVYFALEKEDLAILKDNCDILHLNTTDPIFYQGFSVDGMTVYTRQEIFRHQNRKVPYQKTFSQSTALNDILELEVGDYIVHAQYGIGQYLGVETKEIKGVKKDYLHVAYRGGDDLFVPLSQFQLIRKYVSKEGAGTKLSKLGSGEWEKTKKKVNTKVEEIAGRLVELYATRTEDIGFAFPKDDVLEREFDEAFEFESTPDQISATAEIKAEMELAKPMDHLLIGDVGYGKTEVAMRCAFKAICAGKQVAFLCPTTILSLQHFRTLQRRFEQTRAQIALVNRFVSDKEMREIIKRLKEGQIDIVVGTHRLFSKSIQYKDLGLLIIDEEQRFGVSHKEKIKEMKNTIDVLSLSATPIPRTLQMSLIGVRSISQLKTAPAHRHPVQTYIMEQKGPVIKEIISRELARDGQVFYLHNRVQDIFRVANDLAKDFPDAQIGVAHGKMSREEIENILIDFAQGKFQILVCTTIIETGLDIANANTIIIENADRFGLSQLYQIRGRVGRREKLAYCYLMVTPQKQLNEQASKRLKSIKEFTQLGSGYKIAMRDLTIRGAGDMLGPKQAGFIDSVGLDMYLDLLSQAVARKKKLAQMANMEVNIREEAKEKEVPEIKQTNIQMEGYVPVPFTSSDGDKLALYQAIRDIHSEEQLRQYEKRTADIFGRIPKEVQQLFNSRRIDLFASQDSVESVEEKDNRIEIRMTVDWSRKADGLKLFEAMSAVSRQVNMTLKNGAIVINFEKKKHYWELFNKVIEVLNDPLFRKD